MAKAMNSAVYIKTGIMVGLGEEKDEIAELLQDAGLGVVVFR